MISSHFSVGIGTSINILHLATSSKLPVKLVETVDLDDGNLKVALLA